MALGIPPVCGENAKFVTKIMKITKTATPLYSLLTRAILRFDLAIALGASCSRVKNGFSMLMMPMPAIIAKAGAKSTSRRTIEVAK